MNKFIKPQTTEELAKILEENEGSLFYSGGTEIMADYRQGKIPQVTWIDLKQVEGTRELTDETIGSCVFLNELEKPAMLVDVARGVADQTIRNHLTIGGNICGKLPFRETVLPLLALDAEVSILSNREIIKDKLRNRFDKFMKLKPGELVYQFHFDAAEKPYRYQRYTISGSIDYPVMTYLAVKTEEGFFVGLSGYGSVPLYGLFNEWDRQAIMNHFTPVTNDRGSAVYRKKLLQTELEKGAPGETI